MTMDNADRCEEAHALTVAECNKLGLEYDSEDSDGNCIYTAEAQPIFDKHYDSLEEKYES